MSRKELLETLRNLAERSKAEPEGAHGDADDALLEYINDEEITQAFEAIYKWYA